MKVYTVVFSVERFFYGGSVYVAVIAAVNAVLFHHVQHIVIFFASEYRGVVKEGDKLSAQLLSLPRRHFQSSRLSVEKLRVKWGGIVVYPAPCAAHRYAVGEIGVVV